MRLTPIRLALALGLCAGSVAVAAPFIRSFGLGGWVMAMILSVVLPFAIGMVAGRAVWVIGMASSLALPASFLLHDAVLMTDRFTAGRGDWTPLSICAGFSLVLGAMGTAAADGLTRWVERRRQRSRGFPVKLSHQEQHGQP